MSSVGLMKYRRVAQRLKEKFGNGRFHIKDIEDAVFLECGTDPRTIKSAIDRMIRLNLVERVEEPKVFGVAPSTKYKLTPSQNEFF